MRGQFSKRERRLTLNYETWDDELEAFYCGMHADGKIPWSPDKPGYFDRAFRHPRTVAWERPTRLPRPGPEDPYLTRFEHPARSLPLALDHRHKWAYLGQSDWPLPPHPECVCRHEPRAGRVPAPGCPVHGGQK